MRLRVAGPRVWRVLCWGSVVGLLMVLGVPAAPPRVSHLLGWETPGMVVDLYVLEQCVQQGPHCTMTPLASFDGQTFQADVIDLQPQHTYCWRVRPQIAESWGPYSNTVCV